MFFYLTDKLTGQPQDIWHDPNAIALMTLGIGIAAIVIGAIVVIAVGVYQVRQGRIRRKLVYQTLSNAPIVSVNSAVANQVEIDIRFKGTPVKNARLMIVDVKNVGKASIHASDYFDPLTFEFDTKVLQASVLDTTPSTLINPSDLLTFLTLTPQSVQFPTFPLNTNDSIQISILLEEKGTMEVRGRLDQGTIVELEPEEIDDTFTATFVSPVVVVVVVVSLTAISILFFSASAAGAAVAAVAVGGVAAAMVVAAAGVAAAALRIWTTRR
jgi:hypothetical protein